MENSIGNVVFVNEESELVSSVVVGACCRSRSQIFLEEEKLGGDERGVEFPSTTTDVRGKR